jgi:hypothetical protein
MSDDLTQAYGILIIILTLVLGYTFSLVLIPSAPALQLTGSSVLIPDSSPSDWIKEDQIKVYKNSVVLDLEDPLWVGFSPTNSMTPLLDHNSHGIEIKPDSEDDLNIGDVVAYTNPKGDVVIHRIVEISEDKNGKYFTFQGDNVPYEDPYKVRFNQIQGVLVAVIY